MKPSSKQSKKKPPPVIMAQPVPEAEAERRLRPVMDALYGHNTKQALKLVQQGLQKRPGWPSARALRSCIYLQADKWELAAQDMAQLRADLAAGQVPLDEDAAKKMQMYYTEVRDDGAAGEVYEAVWRTNPTQLRLAELAFSFYIRGSRFSDAQKLATKLNKLVVASTAAASSSSAHHKYAVMATAALWLGIVVKARQTSTSDSAPDARMLKLGCAMLNKALLPPPPPPPASSTPATGAAPSAETLRFAVRVFKDAADYESADRLMALPNLIIDDAELLAMRADIAYLRDRDPTHYRAFLSCHNPNDWSYWLRLFDCLATASQSSPEGWIPDAHAFVDEVIGSNVVASAREPPRGPHLARLELHLRANDLDALVGGLVDYFERFGSKPVCLRDLRPYVSILRDNSPDMIDTLYERLSKVAESQSSSHHRTLCWLQLWVGRLKDTPEELMKRFYDSVIDTLAPTERQPGDDYVILAAHQLLPDLPKPSGENGLGETDSALRDTKDRADRYQYTATVVKTVAILEAALTYSPFNIDFKLLLIHLYIELGGVERVAELWSSLEVKHVQLSTLTHLVLRPFFETGQHEALRTLLDGVDGLWRECDREIPECTTRAFTGGSTNAAAEFVLFRMRLSRSVILAEAMVVEALLSVIEAEGEPIGLQRALLLLTTQPRFTAADLAEQQSIVSNDDTQALRFWEVSSYDPDCRLDSATDDALEEGKQCGTERKKVVAEEVASLITLLSVGRDNTKISADVLETLGMDDKEDRNNTGSDVNDQSSSKEKETGNTVNVDGLRNSSRLRVNIAQNLLHIERLLSKFTPVAGGVHAKHAENSNDDALPSGDAVVRTAKKLTEELIAWVNGIVRVEACGPPGNEGSLATSTTTSMSPRRLRACSKVTYETIMTVAMAITSLGPRLSRGQRRVKKDANAAKALDCAREAVLTYRGGLLTACTAIHEWFAVGLDGEADWSAPIFDQLQFSGSSAVSGCKSCNCGENSNGESGNRSGEDAQLLPEQVQAVDLQSGSKGGETMDREDFVKWVCERVTTGHTITCSTLLETLRCITSRLKLSDI